MANKIDRKNMPLMCACTSPPTQMVNVHESLMGSAVTYMCIVCHSEKVVTESYSTGKIRVTNK